MARDEQRESALGNYGWYYGNSGSKTHPVKTKKPNGLGLYDMSGNVSEWVSDRFAEKYYVVRGGGWNDNPWGQRASVRGFILPDNRFYDRGFRLARTP